MTSARLPLLLVPLLLAGAAWAADPPTARPAVGTPLTEAETLVRGGRFAEALAKVDDAERAATDLSPYERYVVARTRAAAALGAGRTDTALASTEAAIATGVLAGPEQLQLVQSLVHASYRAKDYARAFRWAERHVQLGGDPAVLGALRVQALYFGGEHAAAAAALKAQVDADEAAGRVTGERELQMLANSQRHLKDDAGLVATMERLATRHPKPAYWSDLIARAGGRTTGDRWMLDLLRLSRATGNLDGADDHVVLARLAMNAGFPGEALKVLDEAQAKGLLVAAPHRALHDQARAQSAEDAAARGRDEAAVRAARDGNGLVTMGQAASAEGRLEAGIAMIEQGLAKGGVRKPDEARLRLGEAQAMAGRRDDAARTLAALQGPEGLTEVARLWRLYAGTARPQ